MVGSHTQCIGSRLLPVAFAALIVLLAGSNIARAADQQLTMQYSFERPTISQIEIDGNMYSRLSMAECPNGGNIGQPALPACGAKLLIPFGTEVTGISIVPGERVSLGNGYTVEPIGPQFPLSEGPDSVGLPTPNAELYASESPFPAERFQNAGMHSFRGYEILILKLQPVEYIPATGELFYYTDLTIVVDTEATGRISALYRGLPSDEIEVAGKVDNIQTIKSYEPAGARTSRSFKLMILTTPSLVSAFEPLMNYHNANGMTTEIHTSDDVGSTDPVAVRDYIRDRYMIDGIDYVIIGGDDDVFPAKDLYVDYGDGGGGITTMPGDIFFTCLDGTWNSDNDSRFGEPTDGPDGRDVDMVAEVYLGRAAVGNATEATRFVDKSIWYMSGSHPQPEKVLLVGEHLGFGGVSEYAGNTLDELIDGSMANGYVTTGIPSDIYEVDRLYERDWAGNNWPQSELITRIDNGIHILNHLGHGAETYAMKLYNSDVINDLSNDQLCFVYSQTCLAGHFDGTDCWAETMHIKVDHGAFAAIMNARYGFGAFNSTDGASQRFNREFWDAVYDVSEGKPQLGPANADSKEDNIYRMDEDYMRWCCYELNIFGDPTMTVMGVTGFTLTADPGQQEICVPAVDEVSYTIEVGQLGDFDETITLTTSGEPAGAVVNFTVNSAVPPFTTEMTISGLSGAPADAYSIVITGNSATLQRATMVGLFIADDAPAQVTLTSPAAGETGVGLMPVLNWQAAAQAQTYDLELATDAAFTNVIYTATTTDTSHAVDLALDTLSTYYWHVRGTNICGAGDYSDAFSFTTVNMIRPVAYDMLNGETGSYSYFDDSYDGDGDPTSPLSPLSGGLGELVDGVIATENWNQNNEPFVGWVSVDPTITFHFDGTVAISRVILYVDDSNGSGGVYPPEDITISMGGTTLEFEGEDPASGEPFGMVFDDLGLEGDTMEITIADHSSSYSYMMLTEVEFFSDEQPCEGDLDGDGVVDLSDLAQLLANYGTTGGATYEQGDMDGDGDVDLSDLAALLAVYGTTCP